MIMSRMDNFRTNLFSSSILATSVALACGIPAMAQAQDEPTEQSPAASDLPEADDGMNEIVVTGTLIRGVAPTGTQVVAVSQEDIIKTGVASTNNLLASMPLVSTFNSVAPTPSDLGNQANRPNIRGLQIDQYAPSTTLLLMDGHNMVGASILQTTPDPTMIPPGAVERVEVVPDGGSALYGSDAVSGIVNFITRKQFDGTEVAVHRGFANNYDSRDISVTHGINWDDGSAVISYFGRDNSALMTRDRDRPAQDLRPWGGNDYRATQCNPANIIVDNGDNTTTSYALPEGTPTFDNLTPGTLNYCDQQQQGFAIVPEEYQHSIFLAMQHEISPSVHMEMTGYYSRRKTSTPETQLSASLLIDDTNPYFTPVQGETQHTVLFSYADAVGPWNRINQGGPSFYSKSFLKSYGVTPKLTVELSPSWEVEALLNYGWSEMILHDPKRNGSYETAAIRQGNSAIPLTMDTAINPYDIGTTNPAVLQGILNWDNNARTVQILKQARVIANGSLFQLGGEDVRVAIGGQVSEETYDAMNVDAPYGSTMGAARKNETRKVYALFGEVRLPLVGPDNAMPGIQSLTVNASGRYDKYENCCETTNPKIGVTWEPFDSLSVRGSWGKSFNAPSMADTGGAIDTRVIVGTTNENQLAPVSRDPLVNSAVDLLRPSLAVPGGNADLQPQTAETYSVGADWRPNFLPNLRVSVTYWNVALYGMIGTSTMNIQQQYITPAWHQYHILRPTLQQALDAFGGLQDTRVQGGNSLEELYQGPESTWPYVLRDLRRHNLGNQYVDGIDWEIAYARPTGFGAVRASMNASYILKRESEAFAGADRVDMLVTDNRQLTMSSNLAVDIANFTASATLNYSGGYDVIGVPGQDRVKAYTPVNLFFRYGLEGPGLLRDMDLTLNIDNVFNTDLPFVNTGNGIARGVSTIGRYFNFGIRKRF